MKKRTAVICLAVLAILLFCCGFAHAELKLNKLPPKDKVPVYWLPFESEMPPVPVVEKTEEGYRISGLKAWGVNPEALSDYRYQAGWRPDKEVRYDDKIELIGEAVMGRYHVKLPLSGSKKQNLEIEIYNLPEAENAYVIDPIQFRYPINKTDYVEFYPNGGYTVVQGGQSSLRSMVTYDASGNLIKGFYTSGKGKTDQTCMFELGEDYNTGEPIYSIEAWKTVRTEDKEGRIVGTSTTIDWQPITLTGNETIPVVTRRRYTAEGGFDLDKMDQINKISKQKGVFLKWPLTDALPADLPEVSFEEADGKYLVTIRNVADWGFSDYIVGSVFDFSDNSTDGKKVKWSTDTSVDTLKWSIEPLPKDEIRIYTAENWKSNITDGSGAKGIESVGLATWIPSEVPYMSFSIKGKSGNIVAIRIGSDGKVERDFARTTKEGWTIAASYDENGLLSGYVVKIPNEKSFYYNLIGLREHGNMESAVVSICESPDIDLILPVLDK